MTTASSVLNRVDVIPKSFAYRFVLHYSHKFASKPTNLGFPKTGFADSYSKFFFPKITGSEISECGSIGFPTVARWSREKIETVRETEADTKDSLSVEGAK